ncbi:MULTISPECIES: hypothetical protein [Microbacterium]|uniref:hypothetical protein n=1 Tax=Microbacterium TaxID=33882 RepID=UPI0027853A55|nr:MULTISPECIES: hypothetical protein [Microbacterium]MDQ1083028.1 hypothetical protein [Microbacterium sp. SORGH_AS_0344]MDQ1168205.1 hypothetical protein [Microbacterium proteolyticum]
MTEMPPPTRRARKDAPAAAGDPPLPPGGAVAQVPATAQGTVAGPPRPVGAALPPAPGGDAPASGASLAAADQPFVDDPERMPTAQLEMAAFGDHLIPYVPPVPPAPRSLAPWALGLAILALTASFFTGWLLLLGVVALVFSALSLRRAHDSRGVAAWAMVLAVLSLLFSVGWLIWGFSQLAVV